MELLVLDMYSVMYSVKKLKEIELVKICHAYIDLILKKEFEKNYYEILEVLYYSNISFTVEVRICKSIWIDYTPVIMNFDILIFTCF